MSQIREPGDSRISDYVGLTDVARRHAVEAGIDGDDGGHGFFIAEGLQVIERAVAAGFALRSMLVDEKRLGLVEHLVTTTAAPAYAAAPAVLKAVTGFHVHRGVLASFARKPPLAVADVVGSARTLIVCEGLTSTTNLGAVLRSAAALGIDGVILSPDCCDPLYRRAVRVSMGEALRLPIARCDGWPAGLDEVRAGGFTVLALTPAPQATPLDEVLRDRASGRLALLLGEEGPGLRPEALGRADVTVRIPMAAGVDSLNVAAAAAVACYLVGRSHLS